MITLRLLGPVEASVDGGEPPAELLWKKNLALLVYLTLSPRHIRTREHLTGLLWGDKQESAARHSLNEALRVLRRSLGDGAITADASSIRLDPGAVTLDIEAFASLEAASEWHAAASLVGGSFMEGFAVPGASEFEDWLTSERSQWERRAIAALVEAADQALATGAPDMAIPFAERAADLSPVSGQALDALLRSLAIAGDRTGALQRFEAHRTMLEERLGLEPEPDLVALADRIRAGREGPEPGSRVAQVALTRRLPLAGRAQAMTSLVGAWGRCTSGKQTAVVAVLGDEGFGKTRLAEELGTRVALGGGAVLTVRGVEADRRAPWNGLLALGRGGLLATRGIASAPAEVHAAFAAQIPEWGDAFRGAAAASPAPLPRAFTELIRAAADEQPVLIIVDDSHHLDPESLEALAALPRDLPDAPVMLLMTVDTAVPCDQMDALRTRLGRDVPGDVLALGPLDIESLRTLGAAAFPGYDDAALDRLARRIAADSAGVPLLAVEILHAVASGLGETGEDLLDHSGAWPAPYHTLTQTSPGELPDTVVSAVRIGYRRVSPPAQLVLAAAAAIGGRVTSAQLAQATGLPGEELHAALDELEWQRWMTSDPLGYQFVAGIVERIVERDMLTPGQRRRWRDAGRGEPD